MSWITKKKRGRKRHECELPEPLGGVWNEIRRAFLREPVPRFEADSIWQCRCGKTWGYEWRMQGDDRRVDPTMYPREVENGLVRLFWVWLTAKEMRARGYRLTYSSGLKPHSWIKTQRPVPTGNTGRGGVRQPPPKTLFLRQGSG